MPVPDGGRVIRRGRRAGGKGKDDLRSRRSNGNSFLERLLAIFSHFFLSPGFAGIGGCFATWTLVT